jgi:L-histidine N-alpha-methyltransferase
MPRALAAGAPRGSALLRDVRIGLTRRQKELPSKYFYDHRGSLLFEQITRLTEYYLTRAERRLLARWMPPLVRSLQPATLVELGAGSGEKTRLILEAMRAAGRGAHYVPIDVSAQFLEQSANRMREDLPWLHVQPVVADFAADLALGFQPAGPVLFAFLGSTIGNFDTAEAIGILRHTRHAMLPEDRFLLGADLRTKPVERIERAYNDAEGVTAEFNRNILRVLNHDLGASFDLDAFAHRAFWSWPDSRIEMHLEALTVQRVHVPGLGIVGLRAGETIRTEICGKYSRAQLEEMLEAAGLEIETWCVDADDQYAILMAKPVSAPERGARDDSHEEWSLDARHAGRSLRHDHRVNADGEHAE